MAAGQDNGRHSGHRKPRRPSAFILTRSSATGTSGSNPISLELNTHGPLGDEPAYWPKDRVFVEYMAADLFTTNS